MRYIEQEYSEYCCSPESFHHAMGGKVRHNEQDYSPEGFYFRKVCNERNGQSTSCSTVCRCCICRIRIVGPLVSFCNACQHIDILLDSLNSEGNVSDL